MIYSASFSDGETITRKTDRIYTHAWKCGSISGFSGTLALAEAQVKSYKRSRPNDTVCEIVPVSILTAEVVKNFKTDNPWKVQRTFHDAISGVRKSWVKAGANRIARYATEAEAQAIADNLNKSKYSIECGYTYEVISD